MELVQVEHLSKHYGPKYAVSDISFSVQQGEVLGLLGPNGAGKTTTLRILSGFLPPSSGLVRVAGFDVLTQSLDARRRLGYLPETVALYQEMTVRDFLGFVAQARRLQGSGARRAIREASEECGVDEVQETIIGRLSRGYRQRVALAQAILHDPDVLILDEPTVGLDPRQITEIRELIRELGRGRAIILSSHILPEVSRVCQRVVIINEGRVVAEDAPANLVARLTGGDRWSLVVRGPRIEVEEELRSQPYVTSLEAHDADGLTRFLVDCRPEEEVGERLAALITGRGWGLRELRLAGMSLEDVFLRLTTREAEAEEEADTEEAVHA